MIIIQKKAQIIFHQSMSHKKLCNYVYIGKVPSNLRNMLTTSENETDRGIDSKIII